MPTLTYRGKAVADNPDLVYQDYITLKKNADMTVARINDTINGGLAGYATVGYVKSGDAKNATKAYVDGLGGINPNGGDAARLLLTQKGLRDGGSVPLDATGRIPANYIDAPPNQRWVRGPWTPPQYFAAAQAITTETTVYSCPVKDPGYPYKLIVFGHLANRSSTDAEYGVFYVRAGAQAATGEIIATGYGAAESSDTVVPTSGDLFTTSYPADLGPNWNVTSLGAAGGYYTVVNGQAVWAPSNTYHSVRYRRIGPPNSDAKTKTDYQKLRMTIGSALFANSYTGVVGNMTLCTRMNDAETDWVGFNLNYNTLTMQYCIDGTVKTMTGANWTPSPAGGVISTNPQVQGMTYDILCGTSFGLRQFYFYRGGVLIGQALDKNNVTKVDSAHRGWGFIGSEGPAAIYTDYAMPAALDSLLMTDAAPSAHHVSIVPSNVAASTVRLGDTTLYVRGVRSGPASTQTVSPYRPNLTVWAVPA